MSKLRRTLSLRRQKKNYNTLDLECDIFKTPPMKLTPLRELGRNQCSTPVVAVGLGVGGSSTSATENKENRRNRGRQIRRKASLSKFPGMTSMKSALFNIGQKLKGAQKIKRVALRDSPYKVNGAYTTPRRSERLANKAGTPSPLTLKMYSPFCIETPGMEDSFTHIRTRRMKSPEMGSPLDANPRRMVKKALAEHHKFAKTMSGASLPTTSGY